MRLASVKTLMPTIAAVMVDMPTVTQFRFTHLAPYKQKQKQHQGGGERRGQKPQLDGKATV